MVHDISTLDKEHTEILEQLEEASDMGNDVSKVFREILVRFRYHLGEENETIVPLLSYLKERMYQGNIENDKQYAEASEKFNKNYESMIKEHRQVQSLIREAEEILEKNPDKRSLDVLRELGHHIELEEEFLYPAGMAAIEIIKLRSKRL